MENQIEKTISLIIEYINNFDAVEDDYLFIVAEMEKIDITKLRPTSPGHRLLINTRHHLDAKPGSEKGRSFYHQMETEARMFSEI